MTNSNEVIALYEAMSGLTEQMLAAARCGDWDRMAMLESVCAAHTATLRQQEAAVALSGSSRVKKVEIIKKLLSDDRQIRELTTPWMTQLSALINNTGTERRLANTYGAV